MKGVDYVWYIFGGLFGDNLFIIIQTLLGTEGGSEKKSVDKV